jgi:hypothetical protein
MIYDRCDHIMVRSTIEVTQMLLVLSLATLLVIVIYDTVY